MELVKCRHCGNTELVHGLKLGQLNGQFMTGGPGQAPDTIGTQWAVYFCPNCGYYGLYPKLYSTLHSVQDEYKRIVAWLDECHAKRAELGSLIERAESIVQAHEDLSSLPADNPIERIISEHFRPIIDRMDDFEAELRRRRGGRGKKRPENVKPK